MGSFWHPFADMSKVQHAPFIIDRGEGIYVFDESGRRYLDAAASLWYMNVGYGRTEIISPRIAIATSPADLDPMSSPTGP